MTLESEQPQRRGSDNPTKLNLALVVDNQPGSSKTSEQQPPLFPWDRGLRQVEITGPRLGDHWDVLNQPSSAGSSSSVVNDGGNAKYLAENESSNHAIFSRDSREDELDHIGAGVGITTDHPEFSEAPQNEAEREDLGDQFKENLGQSIRAALIPVSRAGEKNKFLPNDALGRIITRQRVRHELSRDNVPPESLESLTNQVWEITIPSPSKSLGKKTTRRKIFAILGLMDKVKDIVDFIEYELYDNDLPFELLDGPRPQLRLSVKGRGSDTSHIPFFDKWRAHELESFNTYQWQLIAPYFRLITETKRKVLHYNLQNRIILPFIVDLEQAGRAGGRTAGGYADVWLVQIHPAHHNRCGDTAASYENPSYAVKRLRHSDQKAFDEEVSNLKRFSKSDHLHLIKLLITYKWREQFYLLFPWADGNLQDFWQKFPEPSYPERNYDFTLWFSEQCLGIVQGLKMIHTADVPSEFTDEALDAPKYPIHGRHGDLKPENILWFKSYHNTENSWRGVLKISDFGLTRFHRTQSMSRFENIAVSPTYRAPEYDIASKVSQSYDIWSLGCVLLEFVTWYLLGWEEVDKFSKERAVEDSRAIEDSGHIREDTFFNFVEIKKLNGERQVGARAKRTVENEFHTLFNHKNCSDYILDLLMFTKDKLLRIDPKKRVKCKEIVKKFEELNDECRKDQDYCTKRVKMTPVRVETALSELAASALNLSDKQNDRIRRDSIPEHKGPVEDDSPLNESSDDWPPVDHSVLERVPVDQEKLAAGKDKAKLPPISVLHKDDTQTTLLGRRSNETQKESPQSPKKVHFDNGEQQPLESGASRQEEDVPMKQDQPLDKSDQSEGQGKVTKRYAIQPHPDSGIHSMQYGPWDIGKLPSTLASVNSAKPPESTHVPEQPFNFQIDDAPKDNTSTDNGGTRIQPLYSPGPTDLLRVGSIDKRIRKEPSDEASDGEGFFKGIGPKSQVQGVPITEQPNVPRIQPRKQLLTTLETRPRGVKRFLHCLCCLTSVS